MHMIFFFFFQEKHLVIKQNIINLQHNFVVLVLHHILVPIRICIYTIVVTHYPTVNLAQTKMGQGYKYNINLT